MTTEATTTPTRSPMDARTAFQHCTRGALMSVGAHAFHYGEDMLQFVAKIHPLTKKGSRAGQARKMRVTITLTPMDLYRVQVDYAKGLEIVTHWEDDGIYAEDLARTLLALDSGTEPREVQG